MAATKEVGTAIRGIQDGTHRNVANFDRAVQSVGAATDLAKRSGEALAAIVGLVEAAADQVRSIATAAEEQSAASEEIGRTVDQINRISGETAQAMPRARRRGSGGGGLIGSGATGWAVGVGAGWGLSSS